MRRYIATRLAHAALVLWSTFTAAFLLLYVLPGDEALSKLNVSSGGAALSPEAVRQVRASLGLDDPLPVQYGRSLWNALNGDFGLSVQTGGDALSMFAEGIPETLKLAGVALVLGLMLGGVLALAAAYTRSERLRHAVLSLPPLGVALPSFWVGLVLLQIFSFQWQLLPAMGNEGLASLILPALVLALPTAALTAQIFSRSLDDVFNAPFIETARSRGAGRTRLLFGHALRNSVIPVLTALGMTTGHLIAGSVVVETVFSRSGIGLMTVQAVLFQDTPIVLVAVVFAAAVFVVINLLVDLAYPLIDPRIELRSRGRLSGGSPA